MIEFSNHINCSEPYVVVSTLSPPNPCIALSLWISPPRQFFLHSNNKENKRMVQLYENGVGHLYLLIFLDIHIIPGYLKGYQYLLAIIVSMQLLLISKKSND